MITTGKISELHIIIPLKMTKSRLRNGTDILDKIQCSASVLCLILNLNDKIKINL